MPKRTHTGAATDGARSAPEAGPGGRIAALLRCRLLRRPEIHLWQLLTAAVSGLLLSLAYVGPALPELALLAPAGLLFLVSGNSRNRPGAAACACCRSHADRAAVLGAVFGVSFAAPGLAWLAVVTWLGWAGLVTYFALQFAALAAFVAFATGFLAKCFPTRNARLPLVAIAPVAWVAMEFVRAHALTGFPWLFLGHALSDRLVLIQIADLGGAYAVSFVAALWCSGLADLAWRRVNASSWRRLGSGWIPAGAAAIVLAATAIYGAWRLAGIGAHEGPELVLVQPNIYTPRAAEGDREHEEVYDEVWRELKKLSREGLARANAARAPAADADTLLVWSESMIPGYLNDPEDIETPVWSVRLRVLLGELGVPLLAGSNSTDRHPSAASGSDARLDYNAVYLIGADGDIRRRYDKMHLVPFGEYVPLKEWPIFSGLTPYAVDAADDADDTGYAPGDRAQPLLQWAGRSFGVLVCYEDVFPYLARRSARMGADFLVNLSSEAWFAGTAEIPQHFRISRFRAVENRIPLVRCCNVGVTCFIDAAGRARHVLAGSEYPSGASGSLVAAVPLAGPNVRSFYVRAGDAFAWLCAAVTVAVAGAAAACAVTRLSRRRRERREGV